MRSSCVARPGRRSGSQRPRRTSGRFFRVVRFGAAQTSIRCYSGRRRRYQHQPSSGLSVRQPVRVACATRPQAALRLREELRRRTVATAAAAHSCGTTRIVPFSVAARCTMSIASAASEAISASAAGINDETQRRATEGCAHPVRTRMATFFVAKAARMAGTSAVEVANAHPNSLSANPTHEMRFAARAVNISPSQRRFSSAAVAPKMIRTNDRWAAP